MDNKVIKAVAKREKIVKVSKIEPYRDEYVYDISRKGNRNTFIANDILVHNSLFVSFKPALDHCDWHNLYINTDYLDNIDKPFIVIYGHHVIDIDNDNLIKSFTRLDSDEAKIEIKELYKESNAELIIIDGKWINNKDIFDFTDGMNVIWNWSKELDFVIGFDKFKYGDYFRTSLESHAFKYNVENRQVFELEKISDSIINMAKKKYIQNINYEDGIIHDNLTYIMPKGVELVRSSTPAFARERIPEIVKYLFRNPDSFDIAHLLKMVREMKKEFILCYPDKIDDIAIQTSCSAYNEKVINDKEKVEFVSATHFGVRAAAYHNHLLYKNREYLGKYNMIKAGDKIKIICIKTNSKKDPIKYFGFERGGYPVEFAPEVDLDLHFEKSILSPINSIIKILGLPLINKRLAVLMDIFSEGIIDMSECMVDTSDEIEDDGFNEEMGIFIEEKEDVIME
jgi:hypothetical protein